MISIRYINLIYVFKLLAGNLDISALLVADIHDNASIVDGSTT
jgi:hypothetical protein